MPNLSPILDELESVSPRVEEAVSVLCDHTGYYLGNYIFEGKIQICCLEGKLKGLA
jgi:hypothetical protein